MNIYRNESEFEEAEQDLDLTPALAQIIRSQLQVFGSEFAAEEVGAEGGGCVVLLDKKEKLQDVYQKFPQIESIRPENVTPIDGYINQVYIAGDDGCGVSVFLNTAPPPDCGGKRSTPTKH